MTDPQTIGALAIGCGVGLDVIKTQINNLFTPTTEHLGKYFQKRIERIFIIGDKACKKLMERGVTETRAVSDKLVIQIMESGSREGDDEDGEAMTDLWANLLASAANPNYKEEIPPGFPEILRQLSPVKPASLTNYMAVMSKGETRKPCIRTLDIRLIRTSQYIMATTLPCG